MVHILGESMGIMSIFENLDQVGCGYTIDSFKVGPEETRAIQWIAARPATMEVPANWPPAFENLVSLPSSHNLDLGLTNSTGRMKQCPFQPNICPGDHFVASGVGVLAN